MTTVAYPDSPLGLLALVDDECAKTDDDGEKLMLINKALRRARRHGDRLETWALRRGQYDPCPEHPGTTIFDIGSVISGLECRRTAVEKRIRARIAEAENAPCETERLLADEAEWIVRRANARRIHSHPHFSKNKF